MCTVDDEPTVSFEGVVSFWLASVGKAVACDSSGDAVELSRLLFSRFRGFSRKRFAFGYFYLISPRLAELAFLFCSGFSLFKCYSI